MRQVLIVILTIALISVVFLSYYIGNKRGVNYGVENAKEILAKKAIKREIPTDTLVAKYVKVLTVSNQIHPIVLSGHGKVNAASTINISTEVQGVLNSKIVLKKGTSFKVGQVLFTINNSDIKLALQSKKSAFLTQLTTILPDLSIDYEESYPNWKQFFEKIDVTQPLPILPEFNSVKEKSFIISRNILSQYYSIKSDEERLNKYTITAPFSGSIIESYIESGATVSPGMTVITILKEGKLEIEIPILAKNLSLVKKGQEVELQHSDGNKIMGTVSRIGEYVNTSTQTFPVFVAINGNNENLYNGMYLEATITCNSNQLATEVPRTAIFDDRTIYIVNEMNQLVKQTVNISTLQDKTALITGLENGTRIVSEAIVNVKEGSTVSVLNQD